jgi:membrane protease YdiL (CAAX protease family)
MTETGTGAFTPARPSSAVGRAIVAAVIIVFGLMIAAYVGVQSEAVLGFSRRARYFVQGVVMSAVVVPGVWWLRSRIDGRSLASLGFVLEWKSLGRLAAGIGIIAGPILLAVTLGPLFGWAAVSIDRSGPALQLLVIAVATAFLFEALPEELIFRGYVYKTLSATHARWVASVVTVALFLTMPVLSVPVQQVVLGTVQVGPADHITAGYLITLLIFGTFLQYLRVLTGTIWAGIGFHLAFLLANRIVGPRPTHLIRFTEVTAPGPLLGVVIGSAALIVAGLLAWPWIRRCPIGWRGRELDVPAEPDTSA